MSAVNRTPYNIWGAVIVEVLKLLITQKPGMAFNKWVTLAINYWMDDWLEWKTERTMNGVDEQVTELHQQWDAEEEPQTVFTETKEGETPLGGEMRIRSHWVDE